IEALRRAAVAGQQLPAVLLDATLPDTDGIALARRIRAETQLAGVALILLATSDRSDNSVRCREAQIDSYLLKPVRRAALLDCLPGVSGPPESQTAPAPALTPPADDNAAPGLHILVVEDNAVNQRLAVRFLEKQGHQVAVAGNGNEALALFERQSFDLVLMD